MGKKLTSEDFLVRSRKIHKDIYDYSLVEYVHSKVPIEIICPNHGKFLQTPNKHLSGRGCPKCGKGCRNTAQFKEMSEKIHRGKYDYSHSKYISDGEEIEIICPKHGHFYQRAGNHIRGQGCPTCRKDKMSAIKRNDAKNVLDRVREVHGERYSYELVSGVDRVEKLPIVCEIHGVFYQRLAHHLNGHGCPKCHHRISKPEQEFLDYVGVNPDNRQINVSGKLVDGIKDKTIYEFLGDFWHGNPEKFNDETIHPFIKKTFREIRDKTFDKLKFLSQNGYKVKYIWESDWKKFKGNEYDSPFIQVI